ncbi:MurR/RpiR family transcriptional regulator [Oceanobacter kriegii]|uniref:MurR/RpiR family transcriptional regulator n=1 Tax=Oceanobacter kriegii TaxID=64972 RepID=UPI00042204F2|nr:MurR/RpiR family transcriptional regulator [Oceanobacter kriegii]
MQNTFSSKPEYLATRSAQHIKELMPQLSPSEARVAQYILLNLERIGYETGASIAEKAAVSAITVSRFLKRAGYQGISALKQELQQEMIPVVSEHHQPSAEISRHKEVLDHEMQAMMRLFEQFQSEEWQSLIRHVSTAERVFVSGFQTVRGLAEDFSRRLSLARPKVHYLSAHDGMLGELLGTPERQPGYEVLILIDVIPYARETRIICDIAVEKGVQLVILTDEFCHWASDYTPYVLHNKSKASLFLESTWGLNLASNMLVDGVASQRASSDSRSREWQDMAKRLALF